MANGEDGSGLKLSMLLIDQLYSQQNLQLAAQVGCKEVVAVWPRDRGMLQAAEAAAVDAGLHIGVIEGYGTDDLPLEPIIHNTAGRDAAVAEIAERIQWMGQLGIPVLCYNWMPSADWSRTSVTDVERGGALVTSFVLGDQLVLDGAGSLQVTDQEEAQLKTERGARRTPASELWQNLESFLREILPVCEAAGVSLAMHPDDPPLPELNGHPQIMGSVDSLQRLCQLVPSHCNGITYCQGSLAAASEDILGGIRRLGQHIKFAHFRDEVGGTEEGYFRETFQDTGKTDMAGAIAAYRAVGFAAEIPIRPDHTPTLAGESNEYPGYHILGRLWAVGYMKGLIEATGAAAARSDARL